MKSNSPCSNQLFTLQIQTFNHSEEWIDLHHKFICSYGMTRTFVRFSDSDSGDSKQINKTYPVFEDLGL